MTKFNKGLLFGVSAYLLWGLLPLYWKLVEDAGAYEILAHRGIWSLWCVLLGPFHYSFLLLVYSL
jgi:chloramphenicol-sensitive protein RarD